MFDLTALRNRGIQLEKKQFFECALDYNRLEMLHYLFKRLSGASSSYFPPLTVIKSCIMKSIEFGNDQLLTSILSCCPNAVSALRNVKFSLIFSLNAKVNLKIARILLENNLMLDKGTLQELPWLAVEANDIELIGHMVRTKQNNWSLYNEFNERGETLFNRAYKLGHIKLALLLKQLDDDGETSNPSLNITSNRYGFLKRKGCDENKKPEVVSYKKMLNQE